MEVNKLEVNKLEVNKLEVNKLEVNKLISTLNGMIISSDSNPNMDEWVNDFLIEIKIKLQEQQREIDFWKDIAVNCECNN